MKKFLNVLITLLTLSIWTVSCSKDDTPPIFPVDEDIILRNVSYGSHERHKMDVYLPAGRSTYETKIVVFIHGGGWVGGDKDDFPFGDNLDILKEHFPGFALFNLNYRLVTESEGQFQNQYPTAEEDIKDALAHIHDNSRSYQLSSETYMSGGSAGAHLAALHTLKHNEGNRIAGCIVVSGAFDLVSLYNEGIDEARQVLDVFLGGSPSQKPGEYRQASPINFVTNNSPKFLILHGREDELTPLGQANEFIEALETHNVEHTVFTYSGGHGIPPEHLVEVVEYIKKFLL